jgi:hypothetical protein
MELPNWQLKRTELSSPITEHALVVVGIDRNAHYHPIGSAVFIAAGLAMTAKHVINEFWRRMGPGTQFAGGDEKAADFNIMLIQYPHEETEPALWQGSVGVGASFTDVFFLSVFPANKLAESYKFTKTPMINVLPPAVGERVAGFGYAASEVISGNDTQLTLGLNPYTTSGIVSAVYPEYRDRGMLTFPCFEINTHFIGGMSGGLCSTREGNFAD